MVRGECNCGAVGFEVDSDPPGIFICHCSICRRSTGSNGFSRWIGALDLDQYRWIVCVGREEADQVRSALSGGSASVIIANEHQGGVPDPYELGMSGYRDCLALLDRVMPDVAQHIRGAQATIVAASLRQ